MNLEDFRKLSPEDQRETLANMRCQIAAKMEASFEQAAHHRELESQLVPSIRFKQPTPTTPTRVEVSPPTGDPDVAAREFFQRFPDTKSIRIGTVVYERG